MKMAEMNRLLIRETIVTRFHAVRTVRFKYVLKRMFISLSRLHTSVPSV